MDGKSKYIIAPLIALFLSTMIYLSFINSFHNYGPQGTRFANILDAYPQLPEGSILFLGDSQIREGIDCEVIGDDKCFNLGLAGLLPIQLALEKDRIIKAEPDTVVIGVSAPFFDESINKNDDLFMLLNGHVEIDDFLLKRLTPEEKDLLMMNYFEKAMYKRKFILPLYFGILKQIMYPTEVGPNIVSNFKNPHFFTEQQNIKKLTAKLQDTEIMRIFQIEKSSKRERDSFHYLLRKLKDAGINVIILHMPNNPLTDKVIPESSKKNFNEYLTDLAKTVNVPIINYSGFDIDDFSDLTHLNQKGSKKLSLKLRGEENIIQ